MPNWVQQIFSGSIRGIAHWVMLTVVLPIGLPLLTGWAGYMGNQPWMYILVATGVMFAAMSTGMLRFSEWLDRRSVKGKLEFSQVRAGRAHNQVGVSIGMVWSSRAAVPIEFQVEDVQTRIGDRVPAVRGFTRTSFEVPPGGTAWFHDNAINIGEAPSPGSLEAFVSIRIRYGHPGALRHELTARKQVVLTFNDAGIILGVSWNDAT